MGEAKKRGTYDERKLEAIARNAESFARARARERSYSWAQGRARAYARRLGRPGVRPGFLVRTEAAAGMRAWLLTAALVSIVGGWRCCDCFRFRLW